MKKALIFILSFLFALSAFGTIPNPTNSFDNISTPGVLIVGKSITLGATNVPANTVTNWNQLLGMVTATNIPPIGATNTTANGTVNTNDWFGWFALTNGTYPFMTVGTATYSANGNTASNIAVTASNLAASAYTLAITALQPSDTNTFALTNGTYVFMTVGTSTWSANGNTASNVAASAYNIATTASNLAASADALALTALQPSATNIFAVTNRTYVNMTVGTATYSANGNTASNIAVTASNLAASADALALTALQPSATNAFALTNGTYVFMTVGTATYSANGNTASNIAVTASNLAATADALAVTALQPAATNTFATTNFVILKVAGATNLVNLAGNGVMTNSGAYINGSPLTNGANLTISGGGGGTIAGAGYLGSNQTWVGINTYDGASFIIGTMLFGGSTYIEDNSGFLSMYPSGRELFDPNNILSLNWGNREVVDSNNIVSANWQLRRLYNNSGTVSIDYSGAIQFETNAIANYGLTLPPNNNVFGFSSNSQAITFQTDTTNGEPQQVTVFANQKNQLQIAGAGIYSIGANTNYLLVNTGTIADYANRVSVDYQQRYLYDINFGVSEDYLDRYLVGTNSILVASWKDVLRDVNGNPYLTTATGLQSPATNSAALGANITIATSANSSNNVVALTNALYSTELVLSWTGPVAYNYFVNIYSLNNGISWAYLDSANAVEPTNFVGVDTPAVEFWQGLGQTNYLYSWQQNLYTNYWIIAGSSNLSYVSTQYNQTITNVAPWGADNATIVSAPMIWTETNGVPYAMFNYFSSVTNYPGVPNSWVMAYQSAIDTNDATPTNWSNPTAMRTTDGNLLYNPDDASMLIAGGTNWLVANAYFYSGAANTVTLWYETNGIAGLSNQWQVAVTNWSVIGTGVGNPWPVLYTNSVGQFYMLYDTGLGTEAVATPAGNNPFTNTWTELSQSSILSGNGNLRFAKPRYAATQREQSDIASGIQRSASVNAEMMALYFTGHQMVNQYSQPTFNGLTVNGASSLLGTTIMSNGVIMIGGTMTQSNALRVAFQSNTNNVTVSNGLNTWIQVFNCSNGAITASMPLTSGTAVGQRWEFWKTDGTTNTLTVTRSGALFNNNSSLIITNAGLVTLQSVSNNTWECGYLPFNNSGAGLTTLTPTNIPLNQTTVSGGAILLGTNQPSFIIGDGLSGTNSITGGTTNPVVYITLLGATNINLNGYINTNNWNGLGGGYTLGTLTNGWSGNSNIVINTSLYVTNGGTVSFGGSGGTFTLIGGEIVATNFSDLLFGGTVYIGMNNGTSSSGWGFYGNTMTPPAGANINGISSVTVASGGTIQFNSGSAVVGTNLTGIIPSGISTNLHVITGTSTLSAVGSTLLITNGSIVNVTTP